MECQKPFNTRNASHLDVKDGDVIVHGNYQKAKGTLPQVWKYLTKEDVEPLCMPSRESIEQEIQEILAKKKKSRKVSDLVAQELQDGTSIQELTEDSPGFVMMNLARIKAYQYFALRENQRKLEPIWKPLDVHSFRSTGSMTGPDCEIASWLNSNLLSTRRFKQKQLWLWSTAPNCGKSSLFNALKALNFRCYDLPYDENFYDFYENGFYHFILLDEYTGQKQITFLNKLLQGDHMNLRIKGSQINKTDNLPVIVLSNSSPRDCYKNVTDAKMELLLTRLLVVELTSFSKVTEYLWNEVLGNPDLDDTLCPMK